MGTGSISRSFRSTLRASSSVSSIRLMQREKLTASAFESRPTKFGTGTSPTFYPDSATGTGSTAPTTLNMATDSNCNKVLLNPYARAIGRFTRWSDELFGYQVGSDDDLSFNQRDSAQFAPLGVVVDSAFTWVATPPPRNPMAQDLNTGIRRQGLSPSSTPRSRRRTAAPIWVSPRRRRSSI